MANSEDPDSGSTLLASILNLSVMLGNYLQQTTSRRHFQMHFFLGALRVNALALHDLVFQSLLSK